MRKGEIARYEQFLLFSHCFQKNYSVDTWKQGLVWERVKALLFTTQSWLITTLREKAFLERERTKCWKTNVFFLFQTCFQLQCMYFQFFSHIFQLSASALNLDSSKVLSFGKILTLYSHFDASTTDIFWKCENGRNCSERAISPFPTMFSTQSGNHIPFVHFLWHHIFICCHVGKA